MGLLDQLKFRAWDSAGAITGLLEKWRPRGCKSEKDYENSLYKYLHAELGGIQVTKQFAKGRMRADLVVADKVIVELKHNLDSTSKCQRLIGQISEYKEWPGQVVILLTGDIDPNLKKELSRFLERESLDDNGWGEATVAVFEK